MKVSKVKFLEASEDKVLTKEEQKLILGGYDYNSCCFYVVGGNYYCSPESTYAYEHSEGTWACNTEEAKSLCNCKD